MIARRLAVKSNLKLFTREIMVFGGGSGNIGYSVKSKILPFNPRRLLKVYAEFRNFLANLCRRWCIGVSTEWRCCDGRPQRRKTMVDTFLHASIMRKELSVSRALLRYDLRHLGYVLGPQVRFGPNNGINREMPPRVIGSMVSEYVDRPIYEG